MKVLLIGASGMLAKPVIKRLDQSGFELRLFSRNVKQSMFDKPFDIQNGDVFDKSELENAMTGCEAVHISLSGINEAHAAKAIIDAALKKGIQLISMISGCTVSEQNRWFQMIDNKFRAEQTIIQSGIPYLIFRASWFFESLPLMIRNGKAIIIGRQPNPYRWIAAEDYARWLSISYIKTELYNRIFYVLGSEAYDMKDLLGVYCKMKHPQIKKVTVFPIWIMKIIASLSGKKDLKEIVSLFSYFEKTKEMGNSEETYRLLGYPEISFENWLQSNGLRIT